ncbi:hypothetical protein A1332_18185 [Methylomonas methanica]|uniref:Uncharacterized protein n=2 Tax=Methylomonas methanica TaxID=421 RepID=A0A177M5A1_METMH|nr:hypothetical protein A1332_18185 [Methylomonas methanica]
MFEAALLILDLDPDICGKYTVNSSYWPPGYEEIYEKLLFDASTGELENSFGPRIIRQLNTEDYVPYRLSDVTLANLKAWLIKHNISAPFFESIAPTSKSLQMVKRADVISIVTLSKILAAHHEITTGEACDLITSKIITHQLVCYDISGQRLPQLFGDNDEGIDAATTSFDLKWWTSPEKETLIMDDYGISPNQVAILKAEAARHCDISISLIDGLEEIISTRESLRYDDKQDSIVTRKDLVNLVCLSKAISRYHQMPLPEACNLVTDRIYDAQLPVYNLQGNGLPRPCEKRDAVCEVFNSYWWEEPEKETKYMSGVGMSPTEVAILKIDATKYCQIPSDEISDLFFPVSVKSEIQSLDINLTPKLCEDQQGYISKFLTILNKAAFEFWSTADPDDKTTHPTNDQVASWLKSQGYSDINAKQGAVIIRPEWAASGRRPTK